MFEQDIFQGPGTGTFTTHTFEILFMLAVTFLLGLWLGWVLWSKYRQEAENLRVENLSLNSTTTTLRKENEALKSRTTSDETEQTALEEQLQTMQLDLEQARSQLTVLSSDLEKVLERNRQLESELGLSMNAENQSEISEPESVSEPLPSEPLKEDLPSLEEVANDTTANQPEPQDTQNANSEPELVPLADMDKTTAASPTPESIVPIADLPAEEQPKSRSKTRSKAMDEEEPVIAAVKSGPRDDLKIVEGIGPKIEELLFKAGITTYGQLAATSVQQLQDILDDAGSRFAMHDPGTWSAQSLLAANGEWENLKAYQDFLNAGKRPDK